MEKIVVASDLGARSDRAVLRAAHIAQATGATLSLLHVIDDDLPGAVLQSRTDEAEALLNAMISENQILSDLSQEILVEAGHIDRMLPDIVRQSGADMLVLGGHRNRGMGELLGRPTLSRLLRGVGIPVLVAIGRPEQPYGQVSVGWDFSPAGEGAARAAQKVAPDAEMTLVHGWQEVCTGAPYAFETGGVIPQDVLSSLQSKVQRAAVTLAGADGRAIGAHVVFGPPGHILRQRAQKGEADLLALGRHARTGLARLVLGSTAEDAALYATCDVLIAPPEE